MNVIKLIGGLGNQMFQYALGKNMMLKGFDVAFDDRWYNPDRVPPRPYVLDKFNTKVKFSHFLPRQKLIKEGGYSQTKLRDNCNFSGYWQNPIYHKDALSILKNEFCVKEEYYTDVFLRKREEISNCNSVSVHVRRTDYFDCDFYTMPIDFYHDAIEFVKTIKYVDKVYVFSDDMQWCKENFKDVEFVSGLNYLDFELMKTCKHNILQGNSSFSLWAAYLNDNPDKMVVMPKQTRLREQDWG
jgi:hypothetical protein